MKPRERGGVVDGNLNIYGTSNLIVAGIKFFEIGFIGRYVYCPLFSQCEYG